MISGILVICFLWTQNVSAAPAISFAPARSETRMISLADQISIPESLGSIRKRVIAKDAKAPLIIHLAEAHGNLDAQIHVEQILQHLHKAYGIRTIFMEGAVDQLEPRALQFTGKNDQDLKIARVLEERGIVSGPEIFLLESRQKSLKQIRGFGVEDLPLYLSNLEQFRAVLTQNKKPLGEVQKLKAQLLTESSRELNPDLRKFFKAMIAVTSGLPEEFQTLSRYALQALHLDLTQALPQLDWPQLVRLAKLRKLEPELHPEKAEQEKEKLFAWLKEKKIQDWNESEFHESPRAFLERFYEVASPKGFRFKTYPALSSVLSAKVLQSELDPAALLKEMEALRGKTFNHLARTPREKEIIQSYQNLLLIEKLCKLELTREEYEKVKRLEVRGWKLEGKASLLLTSNFRLQTSYEKALEFYETALKRDQALTDRTLQRMKTLGEDKAVLVTGGFHSEGLEKRFSGRGMSWLEITPKISEAGDSKVYRDAMLMRSVLPSQSQVASPRWTDAHFLKKHGEPRTNFVRSEIRLAAQSLGITFQELRDEAAGKVKTRLPINPPTLIPKSRSEVRMTQDEMLRELARGAYDRVHSEIVTLLNQGLSSPGTQSVTIRRDHYLKHIPNRLGWPPVIDGTEEGVLGTLDKVTKSFRPLEGGDVVAVIFDWKSAVFSHRDTKPLKYVGPISISTHRGLYSGFYKAEGLSLKSSAPKSEWLYNYGPMNVFLIATREQLLDAQIEKIRPESLFIDGKLVLVDHDTTKNKNWQFYGIDQGGVVWYREESFADAQAGWHRDPRWAMLSDKNQEQELAPFPALLEFWRQLQHNPQAEWVKILSPHPDLVLPNGKTYSLSSTGGQENMIRFGYESDGELVLSQSRFSSLHEKLRAWLHRSEARNDDSAGRFLRAEEKMRHVLGKHFNVQPHTLNLHRNVFSGLQERVFRFILLGTLEPLNFLTFNPDFFRSELRGGVRFLQRRMRRSSVPAGRSASSVISSQEQRQPEDNTAGWILFAELGFLAGMIVTVDLLLHKGFYPLKQPRDQFVITVAGLYLYQAYKHREVLKGLFELIFVLIPGFAIGEIQTRWIRTAESLTSPTSGRLPAHSSTRTPKRAELRAGAPWIPEGGGGETTLQAILNHPGFREIQLRFTRITRVESIKRNLETTLRMNRDGTFQYYQFRPHGQDDSGPIQSPNDSELLGYVNQTPAFQRIWKWWTEEKNQPVYVVPSNADFPSWWLILPDGRVFIFCPSTFHDGSNTRINGGMMIEMNVSTWFHGADFFQNGDRILTVADQEPRLKNGKGLLEDPGVLDFFRKNGRGRGSASDAWKPSQRIVRNHSDERSVEVKPPQLDADSQARTLSEDELAAIKGRAAQSAASLMRQLPLPPTQVTPSSPAAASKLIEIHFDHVMEMNAEEFITTHQVEIAQKASRGTQLQNFISITVWRNRSQSQVRSIITSHSQWQSELVSGQVTIRYPRSEVRQDNGLSEAAVVRAVEQTVSVAYTRTLAEQVLRLAVPKAFAAVNQGVTAEEMKAELAKVSLFLNPEFRRAHGLQALAQGDALQGAGQVLISGELFSSRRGEKILRALLSFLAASTPWNQETKARPAYLLAGVHPELEKALHNRNAGLSVSEWGALHRILGFSADSFKSLTQQKLSGPEQNTGLVLSGSQTEVQEFLGRAFAVLQDKAFDPNLTLVQNAAALAVTLRLIHAFAVELSLFKASASKLKRQIPENSLREFAARFFIQNLGRPVGFKENGALDLSASFVYAQIQMLATQKSA